MGEVVNTTVKAAKKGVKKGFKIWLACILAIILVVTSAGGSFLILSKVFEAKLNQMVNDQYKGETGEQGPQGPQGVSILSIEKTGTSGNADIYTISYSNGLTTTFQVKNGDDGEAPIIGENGNWWINGEDTGVLADVELNMPYIGTNGNWWLGDSDTNVKAQGKDGLTPYIKDGNWWIGETDTGVAASGTGTGTGVGITTITPLDKTSDDYKNYLAVHSELDADLTDVYKILYSNETVSYFHVINGRDGGNGGTNGTNGADANRWLNGTTEPANTLGNPGDFYLHTPTNDVYQKQITGTATNQYDGVLVEQTLDADTFATIRDNAASYGIALNQGSVDFADNVNIAQINAMTTATGLEQSFYYYHWNYREDVTHDVVHLFGYYAAEGALQVNGSIITKIHYEWTKVTTLNGADGNDGTNGKSAYEVWRDYTEEDGTQPNAGKDENEFLNSLIIGSLEDFTILPSGFWGKKTDADFDIDEIDDYEKYLYEEIDGVYYKNTMVAARGEQGVIGQQGEQGVQGERGYSAYELYTQTTKDNSVKSMNDWLASLVGQKGDQGEAGYTPYVGPNGNWWINNTDTGVSATVRLPYIGENGNWFINGVDQGIKPTGERGNGIAKINVTTSADGIVSTYRIIFTDPDMEPFVFNVTNGTDGKSAYEVWRDYTDDEGNQPNLHKSAAEFFQALMGTDGNGIESIELVARGDSGNDYVDTYKVTYTAQEPYYFTVRNGRDGKSVYDIWCEQQGYTDYADNKYYADFINAMSVSTIEGLTVLDNGHWGVLSNYETVEDANAADPEGVYSVGYQNKIYKDTGNAAKGDTGATGKSAYEIYVYYFNNNVANNGKSPLSEFEWLESLKGATGAAGKDAQLEITESGYWKIGGVVTNMKVQGEKGEQGDTPYIDADGYWCVGNTNLGVLAKGPKGDKGDTGATGISITGVSKLGSNGAVDTYEIAFSDGSTTSFTVTNGTNGTNGKDGADITMDFGVPTIAGVTGKNGDIYINLNNGEMYRYNNGWGTVVGTMRGSQWFTGTMTLTNLNSGSSGVNIDGYSVIKNDIYLNTNTREIYKYDGDKWVYLSSLGGGASLEDVWVNTGSKVIRVNANVNVVGIHIKTNYNYSHLKLIHIGRRNCGAEVLISHDDSGDLVYFAGKNLGLESDGWSRNPSGSYLSISYNGTDYTGAYTKVINEYEYWVYFVFGGYSTDRATWLYSTQYEDTLSIQTQTYDIGTFVNMFKDSSNNIKRLTTFDPEA